MLNNTVLWNKIYTAHDHTNLLTYFGAIAVISDACTKLNSGFFKGKFVRFNSWFIFVTFLFCY